MSHTELVREFTEQSLGINLPSRPTEMTKAEVKFITRMVLSELMELTDTVSDSQEDNIRFFTECVNSVDLPSHKEYPTRYALIAAQYDAFVDAWYYMLNASVKKGVDLDGIFTVVHQANMNKRFPDGTFHRRNDGKIIKPDNWQEADIEGEIMRQMQ